MKKKIYLLFITLFFSQLAPVVADEIIIPKLKPTKEEFKKLIIDVIPLKKPSITSNKKLVIKKKLEIVKKKQIYYLKKNHFYLKM